MSMSPEFRTTLTGIDADLERLTIGRGGAKVISMLSVPLTKNDESLMVVGGTD